LVRFAVVAALALVGVLLVTLLLPSPPSNATQGVVQRVVDGDTLVISIEGKEEDVRVLNIDTPETKHPGEPVECLGREATEFTETWAPPGTAVTLSFDEVRRDQYGRLLAWVEGSDGTSLSEALAEAGLGVPVEYGDNVAFHPRVTAARDRAMEQRRGFFDESIGCTAPAQFAEVQTQLRAASQTPRGDTVESLAAPTAALTAAVACPSLRRASSVPTSSTS
jgi:micrococcal nuclease